MLITCISDTHELHRDVVVPDGDLLLFAGDITFFSQRGAAIDDFDDWLGEQPHRFKVVIPGNHDRLLELPKHRAKITNAHLLINSGIELGGLNIWGSPITPYADTAFGIPTAAARRNHWAQMPANLDILITHSPPHRVLDCAPGETFNSGCQQLREEVIRKHPRLHVFGHVHGAYGTAATPNTLFVNAALAGSLADLDRSPIQLKYDPMPVN